MKDKYMITLETESGKLLYNEDFNIFSVKHGTVYTNKQKALAKVLHARKYGTSQSGKITVEKI